MTFLEFYNTRGNYLLDYLISYHHLWSAVPGKIMVASYENLIRDFRAEARRIYAFIGINQPDSIMDRIIETTSIQSLRKRWNEENQAENQRFFRKGQSGEWKIHFTPSIESAYWKKIGHVKTIIDENCIG